MGYPSVVRYFVIAHDGQKYGPADIPTLNQWIVEGRLLPTQMLQDEASGGQIVASAVPGLNFPLNGSPYAPPTGGTIGGSPNSNYNQGQPYQQAYVRPNAYMGDDGSNDMRTAWICAVMALLCCPLVGIAGAVAANKAQQKGHPQGQLALILNILALVINCGAGAALRGMVPGVGGR